MTKRTVGGPSHADETAGNSLQAAEMPSRGIPLRADSLRRISNISILAAKVDAIVEWAWNSFMGEQAEQLIDP
jgi:hypothetical protein